jgi:hypothetical protein
VTDSNKSRQRNPLIGGARMQREVRNLLTASDGMTAKHLAEQVSTPSTTRTSKRIIRVARVQFVLDSIPDAHIDHWTKQEGSNKWDAVWMISPPPLDTPRPDDPNDLCTS